MAGSPYTIPPKHSQFKPGQSGNPGGKPKNLLTKDKIKAVMSKYSDFSIGELKAVVENDESPAIDAMVASIMWKIIRDGDAMKLDFLFNRMIGKVKEEIEVNNNEERARLLKLSLPELSLYVQDYVKKLPEAT